MTLLTTKKRSNWIAPLLLLLTGAGAWSYWQEKKVGEGMTAAAVKYLATLDEKQRKTSQLDYADTKQRVGWHFIPKDHRKGLQIRHMNEKQRAAAKALAQSCLSRVGYEKARNIMQLESLLDALEENSRFARDPLRYYFTVFGDPKPDSRWGLSIEGHHLSLNFVVDKNEVISSTPSFYATNPATVMDAYPGDHGVKKGTRVLDKEERLAFELVNSLTAEQRKVAIIADKAPREIRGAGSMQPPQDKAVGLRIGDMTEAQQQLAQQLGAAYLENMPESVRQKRVAALEGAGPEEIRFAWAGATKPGVGHYYRFQGPTLLVEFVNTQPDAAGNPANHVHAVWRDMRGDFALPVKP